MKRKISTNPQVYIREFPYGTVEKERILRHLPKHREIQKTAGLQRPYPPPPFAKLYKLTRHLYETSCPKLEDMIQK